MNGNANIENGANELKTNELLETIAPQNNGIAAHKARADLGGIMSALEELPFETALEYAYICGHQKGVYQGIGEATENTVIDLKCVCELLQLYSERLDAEAPNDLDNAGAWLFARRINNPLGSLLWAARGLLYGRIDALNALLNETTPHKKEG